MRAAREQLLHDVAISEQNGTRWIHVKVKELKEVLTAAADVEKLARDICEALSTTKSNVNWMEIVREAVRRSLQPPQPQSENGWTRVEDGLPDDDSDVYAAIPWTHAQSGERKYIIHDCSYYEGGKLPDGSQQRIFTDCEGEEFEAQEVGYWIYKHRLADQLPALAAIPEPPPPAKEKD